MEVLSSVEAVRSWSRAARDRGLRVGLVPTMGYLHEGHLSLIRAAAERADRVIVSIFVNPTQFGPGEDLDRYPRDPEGDLRKASEAGAHLVFLPSVEAMYPAGRGTTVHVTGLSDVLCGPRRPGHFDGVCTVVLKLLHITGCDLAVFGEKDYQQRTVIARMVADLNLPVEIVGQPIVREPDGLAMSSRNVYLSPEQRRGALALWRGLLEVEAAWAEGERDPRRLERLARARIDAARPDAVDYVEARDASDLAALRGPVEAGRRVVVAVAVRFGATRLIDNVVLEI